MCCKIINSNWPLCSSDGTTSTSVYAKQKAVKFNLTLIKDSFEGGITEKSIVASFDKGGGDSEQYSVDSQSLEVSSINVNASFVSHWRFT